MKLALGLRAHSGWAALVALGHVSGHVQVVQRRRLELVEASQARWAKQPYHAAEKLPADAARSTVQRGTRAARRLAVRELGAAVARSRKAGHEVVACAILALAPLPGWSVEEILAVHFRMHRAEGFLFRDALARAGTRCGLDVVAVPEKDLRARAAATLGGPVSRLESTLARLGRSIGPPWGRDQKDAALAAWIALGRHGEAAR